jgi:hypothetical protein
MIVTYRTHTEVLFTRPQTAHPALGDEVILTPEGGEAQHYHVIDVTWPLVIPSRSSAIPDEGDIAVHVLLTPLQEGKALR